ncbi:hypothetical protein Hanom_Chr00s000003g01605721 [Helianthus anomalus]
MAIKMKPQGRRFKKFEIWTKMAKVSKPQGPKWQFTLNLKKGKNKVNFKCVPTYKSNVVYTLVNLNFKIKLLILNLEILY